MYVLGTQGHEVGPACGNSSETSKAWPMGNPMYIGDCEGSAVAGRTSPRNLYIANCGHILCVNALGLGRTTSQEESQEEDQSWAFESDTENDALVANLGWTPRLTLRKGRHFRYSSPVLPYCPLKHKPSPPAIPRASPARRPHKLRIPQTRRPSSEMVLPHYRSAMDYLILGPEIGAGTFGRVNTAFDMRSGVTYAVKRLIHSADGGKSDRARANAEEIKVMSRVRHENIVRYVDSRVSQDGEHLEICMEFVPGGSVASRVREFGPLGDQLVGKLTRDMLAGVSFLHEQGVIHRDIKGGNVLITRDGRAKVADFGCAKLLPDLDTADREETLRRIRGSIPWMAPEVAREEYYHYPADIWSLGATVLEMTSGKRPWHHIAAQFTAIFTIGSTKAPPPIPETASDTVRDFMLCCFRLQPEERASAAELAQHCLVVG